MNTKHKDVNGSHPCLRSLRVSLRGCLILLLMHKQILCCPKVCQACNGRQVKCRDLGLTTVPKALPKTTTLLYLNGNNISHISTNEFIELEKLSVLYLDNSSVCYLHPGAFASLKKLYYLYLNDNCIKRLYPGVFEGLSDLNILHLQNNQIVFLPPGLFGQLKAVRYLSLQRNHLCVLGNNTFFGLISLRTLNLSNNNISHISEAAFHHLEGLEILYLEGNHLMQVPTKALEILKHLKRLSLSNNPLGSIHNFAFQGLDSMQYLFLVNSNIHTIHEKAFYGINNLKQLILSRNELNTLDSKTFTYLNHLMYLQLDRNNIWAISDSTFEEMGASLKVLNLAFNNMTFLQPKVLQPLISLTHFQANYNPWNCECDLLGIRNFLLLSSFTFSINCQNPSRLRGRSLRNIRQNEIENCLSVNTLPPKAQDVDLLSTVAIHSHAESATYMPLSDASSESFQDVSLSTLPTFTEPTGSNVPRNTSELDLLHVEIPPKHVPANLTQDAGSRFPPAVITVSLKPLVICQQQVESVNQSFHILLSFFVLSCVVIILLSVQIFRLSKKTSENQVDNVLEYYSCYQSSRYQMTEPVRITPPTPAQCSEIDLIRPLKQAAPETQVILFEHSVL
ncbi:leucine-rich repeat-containing protein 70 [Spea bombifrons]|uniref:leucine-rich repeat-containing protein 70 n=1 Tax=Spea bombifrons TaxID=233779 RepID=UPI00234ADFCF|nr:leucine-rich repeat-containing protein 70 [Spea bombifrons]